MVAAFDKAKGFFVTLLKAPAATYGVTLPLTRESPDAVVNSAFRNASGKELGTMSKLVLLAQALFFVCRRGSETTHRCSESSLNPKM